MLAYTFYPIDPRVRREAEALAMRGDTVDFICLQEPGDTTKKDYNQDYGVQLGNSGAGGETHGSGDVMLFAGGAGRDVFKGTIDNTKVFSLIRTASGL